MPADGRCCYIDLDSTLLGYGGSILRTGDNAPTDAGIRALEALHAAGVPFVFVSGRSRLRLETIGRLVGAHSVLAELGALEAGYPTAPGQTVLEAVSATGIIDELLARESLLEIHPGASLGPRGQPLPARHRQRRYRAVGDRLQRRRPALRRQRTHRPGERPRVPRPAGRREQSGGRAGAPVQLRVRSGGVPGRRRLRRGHGHRRPRRGRSPWCATAPTPIPTWRRARDWITRASNGPGVLEAVTAWLAGSAPRPDGRPR